MARVLTEDHKKAMQVGRRKAGASRRKDAIKRVKAYLKWSKEDARIWALYHGGFITRKQWLARKPGPLGFVPSDDDFRIYREEGGIV